MAADVCRAPADAYFEVAEWLGPKFFETPPPASGRIVEVYGRDRAITTWYLPINRSVALIDWCRAMPGLAVKSVQDYVDSRWAP